MFTTIIVYFTGTTLIKIRFVLAFILIFHFRHAKIRNANIEKVNCTSRKIDISKN
jgi:hypothetical protein